MARYEIQVEGHLPSGWFEEFAAEYLDGRTVLTGTLADQSALHGVLARFRDLNLTLLLVRRLPDTAILPPVEPGTVGGPRGS